MDEDTLADLKQFISAVIFQQTNDLQQDIHRLDQKFNKVEKKLSQQIDEVGKLSTRLIQHIKDIDTKVDLLVGAISEKTEEDHQSATSTLRNHEKRIHQLEQQAA